MRYFRFIVKLLLGLVLLLLLLIAASVVPIDETPYRQTDFYRQTKARLAALPLPPKPTAPLQAGWAKVNITPAYTTPTGGYGVRRGKHWTTVHDSVFVRTMVFSNGSNTVAVLALDLLITPPTVAAQLKKRLPEVGLTWDNVYSGAIHSHNSVGGWAPGLVGELIAGDFDEKLVGRLTDAILQSIRLAKQRMAPVTVGYDEVDGTPFIHNRRDDSGPVDGPIRTLKFRKASGETAYLCTFSGHATIYRAVEGAGHLSRDYPGALVDRIERATGGFAAFMAGAVGTTSPRVEGDSDGRKPVARYADSLARRLLPRLPTIETRPDSALALLTLPLSLREPHARIADGWRLRPGLFLSFYGDYPSELKALRLGPALLLGTPCDFSGELVPDVLPAAQQRGLHLMVTSFDGGYVGYITPDRYYHEKHYETRDMNWFGPGNGAYFTEMMRGLAGKL